jgi:hypothetical protein
MGARVTRAAALAASFRTTGLDEQTIYLHAFLVAVLGLLVVVGSLGPVMTHLFQCRLKGMGDYSALAREYSRRFDRR